MNSKQYEKLYHKYNFLKSVFQVYKRLVRSFEPSSDSNHDETRDHNKVPLPATEPVVSVIHRVLC